MGGEQCNIVTFSDFEVEIVNVILHPGKIFAAGCQVPTKEELDAAEAKLDEFERKVRHRHKRGEGGREH